MSQPTPVPLDDVDLADLDRFARNEGWAQFDTLRRELGDGFIAVEFEGRGHSVVTEHRQQEAVDRILAFFQERLRQR